MSLPSQLTRPDCVLPERPAPFDGRTVLDVPLDGGVPARIALDADRTLVLAVQLGEARRWMAEPPDAPFTERGARLTLLEAGAVGDTAPVTVGTAVSLGRNGAASVEVVVDTLTLTAGCLRGPGRFGGRIALRWRDLTRAPDTGPPPSPGDPAIPQLTRRLMRWWR